jgi:mRNA interferase MazF
MVIEVIRRGDVWWADLGVPQGSAPGYRRPVVVVQGNALNRSRISTVVCIPLTSNLQWADANGNVLLESKFTKLPKDSVANVSQIITLDRRTLIECTASLPEEIIELILTGIDIVLGRA